MKSPIVNRYQLLSEVGIGGMGMVYQAYDRLIRRVVALKRVRPDVDGSWDNYSRSTAFRLAIVEEFKILASLRHPHIMRVLDYGFDENDVPFYTMTYIERARTIVDAGRGLPLPQKVNLLQQALNALLYLHHQQILHRDIKPANILVDQHMNVTVLDFGLAAGDQSPHTAAGTLRYMAPETLQNGITTRLSDLYSLGVLGFELITESRLYPATHPSQLMAAIIGQPPDLDLVEDPALRQLFSRWIQKDPTQRPQHAREIISELRQFSDGNMLNEMIETQNSLLRGARFVGRLHELQQLTHALHAAKEGRGSAWLIAGESGVGKSRLLDELRTISLVNGATVVRAYGSRDAAVNFQLWRDVLRYLIFNVELSPIEMGILAELLPNIHELLNQQDYFVPVPEVTPALAQDRLMQTIIDVVKRQPKLTVLLLEDLHWADDSLHAIQALTNFVNNLPLMIVGNYRAGERPEMGTVLSGMQMMALDRFERGAIAELSGSILGHDKASPELVSLLEEETAGNVFFILEALRALADDAGDLTAIGELSLPQTITTGSILAVLERRLNRLPAEMQPLLKLAAVLGRVVQPELFYAIKPKREVENWITVCVNGMIFESLASTLQFAHDKLRETILDNLSDGDIVRFNRQAAECIEHAEDDPDLFAAALSTHWQLAQNEAKATSYAMIACEAVSSLANHKETLKFGQRALDGGSLPMSKKVRVMRLVGEARYNMGRLEEADEIYRSAIAFADEDLVRDDIAKILINLATIAVSRADFKEHEKLIREAITYAERRKTRGFATFFLGFVYRLKGDHEVADQYADQALAMFREIDYRYGIMGMINDRSIHKVQYGEFSSAEKLLEECLDLAIQIGNQRSVSIVLCNQANLDLHSGRYQTAIERASRAVSVGENINDMHAVATASIRLGHSQAYRGEIEAGQQTLERAIELASELKRHDLLMQSYIPLSMIALNAGDLDKAKHLLAEIEPYEEGTRPWLRALYQLAVGKHLVACQNYADAHDCFHQSVEWLQDLREPWRHAHSVVHRSHALIHLGEWQAAHLPLINAVQTLYRCGAAPYFLNALVVMSHLYHLNGQTETAAQWLGLAAYHEALSIIETEHLIGSLADIYAQTLGAEPFSGYMEAGARLSFINVIDHIS